MCFQHFFHLRKFSKFFTCWSSLISLNKYTVHPPECCSGEKIGITSIISCAGQFFCRFDVSWLFEKGISLKSNKANLLYIYGFILYLEVKSMHIESEMNKNNIFTSERI